MVFRARLEWIDSLGEKQEMGINPLRKEFVKSLIEWAKSQGATFIKVITYKEQEFTQHYQ